MKKGIRLSPHESTRGSVVPSRHSDASLYILPALAVLLLILFLFDLPFAAFTTMYEHDWESQIQLIQAALSVAGQTGVLWFNDDTNFSIFLYGIIALPLSIGAVWYALSAYQRKRVGRKKSPLIWASILLVVNLLLVAGLLPMTTPPVCTHWAIDGTSPDQCGLPIRPGVTVSPPLP